MPLRPLHKNNAIRELVAERKGDEDPLRRQAIANLKEYASLPDDWDGEGGRAPSRAAILQAFRFLRSLPGHVTIPETEVAGDGEVGLCWQSPNGYAEVNFWGDGRIVYFAKTADGKKKRSDDVPWQTLAELKDLFEIVRLL